MNTFVPVVSALRRRDFLPMREPALRARTLSCSAYYFGLAQCIHFGEHFNMGLDTKSLSESQGSSRDIICPEGRMIFTTKAFERNRNLSNSSFKDSRYGSEDGKAPH